MLLNRFRLSPKAPQYLASSLLLFIPLNANAADQLPDGPGKATLQRVCSACHSAEIVIGKHETKERWEEIVSSMVEKGATGTDEEFNQIIDYLATNFSKPKASANARTEGSMLPSGTK